MFFFCCRSLSWIYHMLLVTMVVIVMPVMIVKRKLKAVYTSGCSWGLTGDLTGYYCHIHCIKKCCQPLIQKNTSSTFIYWANFHRTFFFGLRERVTRCFWPRHCHFVQCELGDKVDDALLAALCIRNSFHSFYLNFTHSN